MPCISCCQVKEPVHKYWQCVSEALLIYSSQLSSSTSHPIGTGTSHSLSINVEPKMLVPQPPKPAPPSQPPPPAEEVISLCIKFPGNYPVSEKKLQFRNGNMKLRAHLNITDWTVREAILFIIEAMNLSDSESNMGLYVNSENLWLDADAPLSQYRGLRFLVYRAFFFIWLW